MNRRRQWLTILALLVGVLIVWQFRHSPEWRQFSWAAVWRATAEAKAGDILGAVVLIYATYVIRTWRWQVLMATPGRFWPILKGTMIGFTGTALLGRPGELVRPYYIARKHRGGLPPQLAVWMLERMFDMSGVVLLVGLDLALNPGIKELTRSGGYQGAIQKAGIVLSAAIVGLIVGLYVFHLRAPKLLARMRMQQEKVRRRWRVKVEHFLETLAQGMEGLRQASKLAMAVGLTMLLWVTVSAAIWLVVKAYPAMLPAFGFAAGIFLMGLTAVGSVLQLPAVGGGFQVLTIFGLTKIFGASAAAATSAALIVWLVCIYAIAPLGAALATHEGVRLRAGDEEAVG
jgi:uncharacterized membrane protein YbhN (UPF0104 family)